MGTPKKQRRKYDTPVKPYDKERIERENNITSSYGLRRKKEIWRAESVLRNFRRRARNLQALSDKAQEEILLGKLNKMGIQCSTMDDILGISLQQLLDRRLQSVVFKKGMAHSMRHSRQLIVHGHVLIKERKIDKPNYFVFAGEEDTIKLNLEPETIKTEPATGTEGAQK